MALAKRFVSELDQLKHLEGIVDRGRETFLEVGNALATIRAGKLWRHADMPIGEVPYVSFDDYAQRRFHYSKSYASLLIQAVDVSEKLTIANRPDNEAQARALADVPEEKREEVMEKAKKKSGGKRTARSIKEAADDLLSDDHDGDTDIDDEEEPEPALPPRTQQDASSGAWEAIGDRIKYYGEICGNAADFADLIECIVEQYDEDPVNAKIHLENFAVAIRSRAA